MNGKWPKVMAMGAKTALGLLYEITTATVLQCPLPACAPVGAAAMFAADR